MDVGADPGRDGDVTAMLSLLGPITHEARRGAESDQHGPGWREQRGTLPRPLCQRHGRFDAAGLRWLEAQERRQSAEVVRDDRLEQQARSTRHAEQLGDRPAASTGDGEHGLAAGRVHRGDRLSP